MIVRTRVKICGITRLDDALCAVASGADSLGFIFYEKSPRHMRPEQVRAITRELPPCVNKTGVFVNSGREEILGIVSTAGLDTIQLHGEDSLNDADFIRRLQAETALPLVLARRVPRLTLEAVTEAQAIRKELGLSAVLFDYLEAGSYGGTGRLMGLDDSLAGHPFVRERLMLAGGLNPANVAGLIRQVKPYAVDVSSGVEKDKGIKDHEKIRRFMEQVQAAGEGL